MPVDVTDLEFVAVTLGVTEGVALRVPDLEVVGLTVDVPDCVCVGLTVGVADEVLVSVL